MSDIETTVEITTKTHTVVHELTPEESAALYASEVLEQAPVTSAVTEELPADTDPGPVPGEVDSTGGESSATIAEPGQTGVDLAIPATGEVTSTLGESSSSAGVAESTSLTDASATSEPSSLGDPATTVAEAAESGATVAPEDAPASAETVAAD